MVCPFNTMQPAIPDVPSIAEHISMGSCTLRETAYKSISCSSIVAQYDFLYAPGTADEPAVHLQVYIMCQIAPILTSRALRHLLDMHGVKYALTDKLSKLLKHLYSFLHSLDRGKGIDEDITLTGTARIARRQDLKRL
jgi:hypothetical protein